MSETIPSPVPVQAQPVKQAITVRARWRKGEPKCDLLAGKSNVLTTQRTDVNGKPQEGAPIHPHLPAFHAFFWSAVEIISLVGNGFDVPSFLAASDFTFYFGANKAFDLPAPLVLNRRYEVAMKSEEFGVGPKSPLPSPAFMESIASSISTEPPTEGDEWKQGADGVGEETDEAETPPTPSEFFGNLFGGMQAALEHDPRQTKPVQVLAHEVFSASLMSTEPAPFDIDLIFVMHGVLARPLADPVIWLRPGSMKSHDELMAMTDDEVREWLRENTGRSAPHIEADLAGIRAYDKALTQEREGQQ